MNNPLVYTDPDGEFPWLILGLTVLGSYLGGVGANQGELNPGKWDWKAPETYIGIGFGGLFGYVGGYGLVNPGTINLAAGIGTPIGGVYLVGNQSDWSFQWTTIAGGGGEIELGNKEETQPISITIERPKWNGPFFLGTDEEAKEMLISESKFLNIETSFWSTTKGYFFESISGDAYGIKYDLLTLNVLNLNEELGYRQNTFSETFRYTYIDNIEGSPYLSPNIFQRARIYYHAHTHPRNSEPHSNDLLVSFLLGIRGVIYGWNDVVFKYGGYGYWK